MTINVSPFFQAVQPKCTAAGTEYDPLTGNCETEQSNDGELLLNHALQVGRGKLLYRS